MLKHSLILSLSILLTPLAYSMRSDAQREAVNQQLIEAAKKGDIPTMQDLITNHHAYVNTFEQARSTCRTPLVCTIENGHTEAAKFLIDHHRDSFLDLPYYALAAAITQQQACIIKLLIERGIVDVNHELHETPRNPLSFAIAQKHKVTCYYPRTITCSKNKECITLVELLLDLGADPNPQSGFTPLMTAAHAKCTLLTECLLAHNATVPPTLSNNTTIIKAQKNQAQLNKAVADKNLQQVLACLHDGILSNGFYCNKTAKAFINQKLFDFVRADNTTALIDLIKCGFGLYARDNKGNTPLHVAIEARSNRVASLLIYLLHRTNLLNTYLLMKNNAGHTPLDLAIHYNQSIIKALWFGDRLPESANWSLINVLIQTLTPNIRTIL